MTHGVPQGAQALNANQSMSGYGKWKQTSFTYLKTLNSNASLEIMRKYISNTDRESQPPHEQTGFRVRLSYHHQHGILGLDSACNFVENSESKCFPSGTASDEKSAALKNWWQIPALSWHRGLPCYIYRQPPADRAKNDRKGLSKWNTIKF